MAGGLGSGLHGRCRIRDMSNVSRKKIPGGSRVCPDLSRVVRRDGSEPPGSSLQPPEKENCLADLSARGFNFETPDRILCCKRCTVAAAGAVVQHTFDAIQSMCESQYWCLLVTCKWGLHQVRIKRLLHPASCTILVPLHRLIPTCLMNCLQRFQIQNRWSEALGTCHAEEKFQP